MKPALKIEVSETANITLVTTEDGVFGLPASAASDPIGMIALTFDDYTNTKYNYFPKDLMPLVRSLGDGDWREVYTYKARPGQSVH